ncbi:MAG: 2Fe-2S iron-sulfur cluster binding domain-containing protein [Myxococcales bacterium]|nr:2Fe-2S iron-sulfur cluster binding domain-containing protein [Myxococcales bacterium]
MSDVPLRIDGKDVTVPEGTTVLEAARRAGVEIPTLCHHPRLAPYGGCRVCVVETEFRGGWRLIAACVYPVESGMVVRTRSEKIDRIRRSVLELLLAHAPDSAKLQELARLYGAKRDRFAPDASYCIHCGLCVRYCAEVKGKFAVGFVDRGIRKEIAFVPGIAARECRDCKECFELCPTSYLQAAFVLAESLAFPPPPAGAKP